MCSQSFREMIAGFKEIWEHLSGCEILKYGNADTNAMVERLTKLTKAMKPSIWKVVGSTPSKVGYYPGEIHGFSIGNGLPNCKT